ncbi:hypothetical protein ABFX02_02G063900 [Erythranthe guttata]
MEDILRVFDDMMERGQLSFQESQRTMQVNHRQAPAPAPTPTPRPTRALTPYSYANTSFNQHQFLNTLAFGAHTVQHFHQPVMFLGGKTNEGGMKNFAPKSQLKSQPKIQHSAGRSGQSGVLSETGTEQVWQRIRWTDDMVKVLIKVASYIAEIASPDCTDGETNPLLTPIKGKWRSISNIMVERGYIVSPQQCEDKFNDLNKKYKRLSDLLGGHASCTVVENPLLMESMNIPEDSKEEIRKILTCKQLFYREMYSYHNKSTRFLPHDPPLQQLVRSTLKGKVKYESSQSQSLTLDMPAKRQKHGEGNCVINVVPEGIEGKKSEWVVPWSVGLADKKLRMHNEMMELEKMKFEWVKVCQEEDKELERLKLENELIKIENERLEFQIMCRRQRGNARPY